MFPKIILALLAFASAFRFLPVEGITSNLPRPDSLAALSSHIRETLSYHGVSEQEWKHGKKSSQVKRIVWQQASGPAKYRIEREGREPFEVIIKGDSLFVSREKQSSDKKHANRRGRHRFSPGRRIFQNLKLLKKNYQLTVEVGKPVAGRPAWRLEIRHRSDNRLAERTWFDRDTGLILARERWNSQSEPIHSLYFSSIEYTDRFDPEIFNTSHFRGRARRKAQEIETGTAEAGRIIKVFKRISFPGGFEPVKSGFVDHKGWPIFHAALTDGLRSLSIFARKAKEKDKDKPSSRRSSGIEARKQIKGEIYYTLVGDLGTEEMEAMFEVLPPDLPLAGSPGRIPRLIALIAFALAVVTLSIVFVKRLLL